MGSFDDANETLCRSLPTETSPADSKVDRSPGALSQQHVIRHANSTVISPRGESEPEILRRAVTQHNAENGDEFDSCDGRNNNTGTGTETSTVVDILNRNFGILSKSHPLHRREGRNDKDSHCEENATNGAVISDKRVYVPPSTPEQTQNEQVLYYDPGTETPPVPQEVESDSDECYYNCESRSHGNAVEKSCFDKEHVYCTVYCIANDGYRKDFEVTEEERHNETPTALPSGAGELQTMARDDVVGVTTPELYSLGDLGDPRASIRLSRVESRQGCTALSNCLVCLLDRSSIVPLRCCGKAVCDECLKRYISSQVRWFWGAVFQRYGGAVVYTCMWQCPF